MPTLDNSTNTNIKYVGIVNNNLYDINSTNTNDGFTINFNYDNTIQFVNIITIDSTTMNKINLWTLKPKTTFKLNAKSNNNVYLLQTVNWTINEARGNTLGYIISGFLSIGFILTIIAIIYDWYLKQQFKKKQSNTKTNVN